MKNDNPIKTVFLVACSKSKAIKALPAKDLYISERFKLTRRLADKFSDKWFIVSAKHGLLTPKTTIEPYDLSIGSLTQKERTSWSIQICSKLLSEIDRQTRVVCFGDASYFERIIPKLIAKKITVYSPLQRLSETNQLEWLKQAQPLSSRSKNLLQFHALLRDCANRTGRLKPLSECNGAMHWPRRGLYIFFGASERRMFAPSELRIVRVGTHGVSNGSKSTLWQRLKTHKGNADRSGNHRASIFRSHIGAALISKGKINCPSWGVGQTADQSVRESEIRIERQVSDYISKLMLLWLDIEDVPSKYSDRAYLEQNIIALLTGPAGPLDVADETWLGYHCPNPSVQRSGLWNVNYTDSQYDPNFLDVLSTYVDVAAGMKPLPRSSLAPSTWLEQARLGYQQKVLDF